MPDEQVVHVLRSGRALCEFSYKTPQEWPENHAWTRIEDVKNITCAECERRAKIIRDSRKTAP